MTIPEEGADRMGRIRLDDGWVYEVAYDEHDFLVVAPTGIPGPGEDRNSWELADTAVETAATPVAPAITVNTDVLELTISTVGGTLERAVLKKYPIEKDHP